MPAHALYLLEYQPGKFTAKCCVHTDAGLTTLCRERGIEFPLGEFPLPTRDNYVVIHGYAPARRITMVVSPEQAREACQDKCRNGVLRYAPFHQTDFDKYIDYATRGFPELDDHRAWQAMLPNRYVTVVLCSRTAELVPETARPVIAAVIKRLHEGLLSRTETMACCEQILGGMSHTDKKGYQDCKDLATHGLIMASAMGIIGDYSTGLVPRLQVAA